MKRSEIYLSIIFSIIILIFIGCNPQSSSPVETNFKTGNEELSLSKQYNLSPNTMSELQQAKIATAKYNDLKNAIADGYSDINVIVPHMGFHYMKSEYVDGTFEIDKPEILVYAPNPSSGRLQLVAVEYAIPNTFPEPGGFTGSDDVWDNNSTFGLWLLHAWVWKYNPNGVFSPMNPDVE